MNPLRTGVMDNGVWLRPDLADCGINTWPELLNQAGYYTAGIGKMHFYPWDLRHGLQYRVIAEDKRWPYIRDDYYNFLQAHGERKYHGVEHEGYLENRGAIVNQAALGTVRRSLRRPRGGPLYRHLWRRRAVRHDGRLPRPALPL